MPCSRSQPTSVGCSGREAEWQTRLPSLSTTSKSSSSKTTAGEATLTMSTRNGSFPAEVVAMKSSVSIGDYLIQRLYAHGVRHVFGIPGDYVLGFYEQLVHSKL